jgi:hypothetical protein
MNNLTIAWSILAGLVMGIVILAIGITVQPNLKTKFAKWTRARHNIKELDDRIIVRRTEHKTLLKTKG